MLGSTLETKLTSVPRDSLIISLISQLSQANERFIPLELFTGGEIHDDTEIKLQKPIWSLETRKEKK